MERIPEAIARLMEELQSGDEFARGQAAFALGMLGAPAVPALVELLGHTERDIRMRAAWSLGVIGAAALPALTALASGDDAVRRVEAIRVLGVVGEARALNALLSGLVDDHPQVAARAATALGKIGDPRAFHALVTALHHPAPDVRFAVCGALSHLHVMDAIPFLEELVASDTGHTSWGASVAESARRAIQEIRSQRESRTDAEFARISELLHTRPKR